MQNKFKNKFKNIRIFLNRKTEKLKNLFREKEIEQQSIIFIERLILISLMKIMAQRFCSSAIAKDMDDCLRECLTHDAVASLNNANQQDWPTPLPSKAEIASCLQTCFDTIFSTAGEVVKNPTPVTNMVSRSPLTSLTGSVIRNVSSSFPVRGSVMETIKTVPLTGSTALETFRSITSIKGGPFYIEPAAGAASVSNITYLSQMTEVYLQYTYVRYLVGTTVLLASYPVVKKAGKVLLRKSYPSRKFLYYYIAKQYKSWNDYLFPKRNSLGFVKPIWIYLKPIGIYLSEKKINYPLLVSFLLLISISIKIFYIYKNRKKNSKKNKSLF